MSTGASFCWVCGGSLKQFGRLSFDTMMVNSQLVRVHKVCKKNPNKWDSDQGKKIMNNALKGNNF